jgi:uncharacterized protein YqgQ
MFPHDLEMCKVEIQELLDRNLIEKSISPWACPRFYLNKHSKPKKDVDCKFQKIE